MGKPKPPTPYAASTSAAAITCREWQIPKSALALTEHTAQHKAQPALRSAAGRCAGVQPHRHADGRSRSEGGATRQSLMVLRPR